MRGTLYVIAVLMSGFLLISCTESPSFVELGTAGNCNATTQPCVVQHERIAVTMTMGPDVVPLKPFPVQVEIQGIEVDAGSVVVDFQMQGMDMGMNRYRLVTENSVWSGEVTLPVCTASRMDWIGMVEFRSAGKTYQVQFPFRTEGN